MKTINYILFTFITVSIWVSGCKPKFYEDAPAPNATPGKLILTSYVAIGSGISAGYMDGALYYAPGDGGQPYSFPALIAGQIAQANPSSVYFQPTVTSAIGWSSGTSSGLGKLVLTAPIGCNTATISPVGIPSPLTHVAQFPGDRSTLTDLSIPFLSANDLSADSLVTQTIGNPVKYGKNVLISPSIGILNQAKARKPTFFTVWIGYEDLLTFATSGGSDSSHFDITILESKIEQLVDSLLATPGASGIIGNLPYVDQVPVITNNNRRLTSSSDPAREPGLLSDSLVAVYNSLLGANIFTTVTGKANNYAIQTAHGIRQINTSTDFIVKSSVLNDVGSGQRDPKATRSCTPDLSQRLLIGLTKPIPNNAVLDATEVARLRTMTDQFNYLLQSFVKTKNAAGTRLAIVDFNAFFNNLTNPGYGVSFGSETVRANDPTLGPDYGGFYSTDRTFPNPKGQSLIANEFIKVINATWGATIPLLNPDNFRSNIIPNISH